jgi:hypothetical protein
MECVLQVIAGGEGMNTELVKQGAWCNIKWRDSGEKSHVYISFSDYNEDNDCDGFGVDDSDVFFYTSTVENFERLLLNDGEDFIILTAKYEYTEALA